jgi:hypothetical protein
MSMTVKHAIDFFPEGWASPCRRSLVEARTANGSVQALEWRRMR